MKAKRIIFICDKKFYNKVAPGYKKQGEDIHSLSVSAIIAGTLVLWSTNDSRATHRSLSPTNKQPVPTNSEDVT